MKSSRVMSLSKSDIEFIKKALADGIILKNIAKHFGVTRSTLSKWINFLEQKDLLNDTTSQVRNQQIVDEFIRCTNVREVATRYKLTVQGIWKILRKNMDKTRFDYHKRIYDKMYGIDYATIRKYIRNPNPPTYTTDMLICNYYDEGVNRKQLPKDIVIEDISIELGRPKKYIREVLVREEALLNSKRSVR